MSLTNETIQQKLTEFAIPFNVLATTGVVGLIKGKNYHPSTPERNPHAVNLEPTLPVLIFGLLVGARFGRRQAPSGFSIEYPPATRPRGNRTLHRSVRVTAGSKDWPALFPQMGPGPKHERPIVLAPWQGEIVEAHPWPFVRGLIHSDGCRTVNRFKTRLPSGRVAGYAYPRYFFSNLSADIRGLFCASCERLGLRWTQSNHRNISISHRASVALLDENVGPKC